MLDGKIKTGLMGRITGNEMMNKTRYVSETSLLWTRARRIRAHTLL